MNVTCPSCSARYRVDAQKIPARGARITCPTCNHKFVAYRPSAQAVIGAPSEPRGLPVTIARQGQLTRADFHDDDDETEAPTTIMAHGSALAREIRKAIENASTPAPAPDRNAGLPDLGAEDDEEAIVAVSHQRGNTPSLSPRLASPGTPISAPASDPLRERAAAMKQARVEEKGSNTGLITVVVILVVLAAVAFFAGVIPGGGGGSTDRPVSAGSP